MSIADEINELGRRVHRLCPSHRNPGHFHEEKSEIANELTRIADRARSGEGRVADRQYPPV